MDFLFLLLEASVFVAASGDSSSFHSLIGCHYWKTYRYRQTTSLSFVPIWFVWSSVEQEKWKTETNEAAYRPELVEIQSYDRQPHIQNIRKLMAGDWIEITAQSSSFDNLFFLELWAYYFSKRTVLKDEKEREIEAAINQIFYSRSKARRETENGSSYHKPANERNIAGRWKTFSWNKSKADGYRIHYGQPLLFFSSLMTRLSVL